MEHPHPHPDLSAPLPAPAAALERAALVAQAADLERVGRGGASWFYWVAGLSLVNTLIQLVEGNVFFVAGVLPTIVVDAVAKGVADANPNAAAAIRAAGLAANLALVGFIAMFGWLSVRRVPGMFALGMALYLLDGVGFAILGDLVPAGFHAFALFGMWGGYSAYGQLAAVEARLRQAQADADDDGEVPARLS